MKKSYGLLLLAIPALMLGACAPDGETNPSTSNKDDETSVVTPVGEHTVTFHLYDDKVETVVVKDNERVKKPADPEREGYLFSGWFTTADGSEEFYFGNRIKKDTDIYAHWADNKPITVDVLEAAFKADYSNCEVTYESSDEMEEPSVIHNYDGYNIVESGMPIPGEPHNYLYYHDYQGESYNWFFYPDEADLGGAWIRKGKKIDTNKYIQLGMDNIYFNPRIHLGKLDAADFTYSDGTFHLTGEEKVNKALEAGAFSYIWQNPIYEVSIALNETRTHVSKIITFDDDNPKGNNKTVTSIFNVGTTEWNLSELPPEPNSSNVKTWYEWKQEEEPTFDNIIKSIKLETVNNPTAEMYVDETIQFHYTFDPIKPDKKNLELKFDGDQEGFKINYDFGEQMLKGKALKAGTYNVYILDKDSGVESNKIAVKVLPTKTTEFINPVYDLELEFDTDGNPSLYNYEDETKIAKFTTSPICVDIENGFQYGENPTFTPLTTGMVFRICDTEAMNNAGDDAYVTFELDSEINAMSFTYGALYANHVLNANDSLKRFTASIYTSKDGVTFDLAEDWTEECKTNLTEKDKRRKDIMFNANTKFVRIGFDSKQFGKGISIAMDTWTFFNEAK